MTDQLVGKKEDSLELNSQLQKLNKSLKEGPSKLRTLRTIAL